ncbi:hypothetical protein [Hymenobacter polaris]|nr:hypothetical protein [Hymenobacter polaris]
MLPKPGLGHLHHDFAEVGAAAHVVQRLLGLGEGKVWLVVR